MMTISSSTRRQATRIMVLALAFMISGIGLADAKRRRRRAKKAPVNEKALAALRGPFKFGMSPGQVLKILRTQIREKYAEKISSTTDVYTQDKLRRKRNKEIAKIKKSYVKFKGKKTGWEGSIIQDQFAHKTDESMMMYWETDPSSGADQRRFFFFHDGKLYKMFIALNSDSLKNEQRNFDYLKKVMQMRFGKGEVTRYKDRDGTDRAKALAWTTKKYKAWAIDNMQVFGSFCLVIADRATTARVAKARAALPKKDKRVRLIDGVIEKPDDEFTLNEGNEDVVDSLTGKRKRR